MIHVGDVLSFPPDASLWGVTAIDAHGYVLVPIDLKGSPMTDYAPTRQAQSGGVAKGSPNTGKAFSGKGGDGLAKAWSNQTAKPSERVNMAMAKKKVR